MASSTVIPMKPYLCHSERSEESLSGSLGACRTEIFRGGSPQDDNLFVDLLHWLADWSGMTISVLMAAFFSFVPALASAQTNIIGTIYGNTTWTLTGSPYVIYGGCSIARVPSNVTLTIDPGVVVKFMPNRWCHGGTPPTNLTIYGNLFVNGTADNPVIFTSFRDDTVFGDTNLDATSTVPLPGDWGALELYPAGSNTVSVKHAKFLYGGSYLGEIRLGKVYGQPNIILQNLELSHSRIYGIFSAMPFTITNSRFRDLTYDAIRTDWFWNPTVDARNNWWGDDSGPKVASNPGGTGLTFTGTVLYDPWIGKNVNHPPTLTFTIETPKGINTSTIFLPSQPIFKIIYSDQDNDAPSAVNVVVNSTTYPMSPTLPSNYASGTIYSFTAPTGTFPKGEYAYYFEAGDGHVTTSLASPPSQGGGSGGLPSFVVKNTPTIIIPGILGSEQKNGVWVMDPILHTYDNLLDTFRANGFTDGMDLFPFPYDWHQSNVLTGFQLHQKIDAVKDICNCAQVNLVAHSMGGLAARQYVQSAYYENDVDQLIFLGTPHLGAPDAYLTWEGGELGKGVMNLLKEFIFSREAKKYGYYDIYDYVRNYVISARELLPIYAYLRDRSTGLIRNYPVNYPQNIFLENLYSSVGRLTNSEIKITNIVGDLGSESTINVIRVVDWASFPLWEHGYPENYDNLIFTDKGLEMGNGDETVPSFSGEFIKNGLNVLASSHIDLPDRAEKMVLNKISGSDKPVLVEKIYVPNMRILVIKILSPADIVVIAPDGKRVGKDFDSGEEINEIDGSFYSGFLTDDEYITIPDPIDGEYKVQMQGTEDGGQYTLATGYISQTSSASNDFIAHILPNQIEELNIVINSSTPDEVVVLPTDITPPVIIITSSTTTDYLHSDKLPINVTATDTESGVFSLQTWFDGILVNNGDQIDLFYQHLGNHIISVSSSDYVGNISTSSQIFRIIATPSSTISDINRSYQLGWINDEEIRDALVNKVQQMIRLQTNKMKEKVDKLLAGQFLKFLSTHLNKQINQQAYNILKEDVEWLININ